MSTDKILLTGGLGFIGHNLALHLKRQGLTPVVFDNFTQNVRNKWHRWVVDQRLNALREAHIEIIPGDTCVFENLRQTMIECAPKKIVHLAAIPSVVLSNQNPGKAIDHNFNATKNMLEIIRLEKLPIDQFVFFSSSTVYGDFTSDTVDENTPTVPKGIYEAAKLSSEIIIKAYHNLMGLPYTIVRPSALYGEGCINNRVSQIFIEQALKGVAITLEGDGNEKLDFTYIGDLVQGVHKTLTNVRALNETFNLTFGDAQPIPMLIDILKSYFPELDVTYIQRDRMKPKRGTLCIDKAKDLLGYIPQFPLEKGYRNYIDWYLNSPFKALVTTEEGVPA